MLVIWSHMRIVHAIMYLGLGITKILPTGVVINLDHALGFLTQQPEVLHVHCTGLLTLDGGVDDASGGGVIVVD